jgi:hypothetical protein
VHGKNSTGVAVGLHTGPPLDPPLELLLDPLPPLLLEPGEQIPSVGFGGSGCVQICPKPQLFGRAGLQSVSH